MRIMQRNLGLAIACAGAGLLAGCWGDDTFTPPSNVKPAFVGVITQTHYDGVSDDLLTAGLGKSGLQGAAPTFADPSHPTPAELRRYAIYNNYRPLVDITTAGGYGTLYGPNVDANGNITTGEGKIAGTEYIAYDDDGTGKQNVTMMIQVPDTFDKSNPCIVTATSPAARGLYGAISSAGEWGLKKGCAVAYTDKGTGIGIHDLQGDTVGLIDGQRATAAAAGTASNFTANLSGSDLAAFNAATPNRFAIKISHSQQNPEQNWGKFTLDAIKFAYYVINEQFAGKNPDGSTKVDFKPANTIVIASSLSNGGGAALAAAEQDTEGLINGVAVSEPQIQLKPNPALTVKRGSAVLSGSGRSLLDYATFAELYQPCAMLALAVAASPGLKFINVSRATNRCASLHAKGLLSSTTTAEQGTEALNIMQDAGWQPESILLHPAYFAVYTHITAVHYSLTYARSSVKDNLCGFSFAPTNASGAVVALSAPQLAQLFGTSSGSVTTGGINLVNNNNPSGPILDGISVSPSTGLVDYNIDGAICMRELVAGNSAAAKQAQASLAQLQVTGNLHGKPAIIVSGRSDALVPVAFASRPYFGMNNIAEGSASKLSYIEVTNANHVDIFAGAAIGYDYILVPLAPYFNRALDAMYNHLKNNTPLPPSQVVRTIPRGGTPGAAPPITAANVPPIPANPATADQITFSNNTVTIPD